MHAFFCALNAQITRFFYYNEHEFFCCNVWITTQCRELRLLVLLILMFLV